MGISSKKTKQTVNQTSSGTTSATTTRNNPEWVTSGLQGLGGQITDLSKVDPYSLVAGPDALQTQAANGASQLTSGAGFGQAGDIYGRIGSGAESVQSQSLLDNLQAYMSPYTNDVVNTTLAGFDQDAGRTRAQDELNLANDTTFGGSSAALTRSMTASDLAMKRAQAEAGLRDAAFTTGAGLSNSDAERRQSASVANLQAKLAAAQGLTSNATAQGADTRANLDTQMDMGSVLQALAQQKAGAPVALTGAVSQMWNTLPLDLLSGQTTNGTTTGTLNGTTTTKQSGASLSDWMNFFAANAQAAASAGASDERLKQDIETVGYDGKGRRWVEWTYRFWPNKRFRGVIAQEVRESDPQAVREGPGGFLFVDYAQLGA